MEIYTRSFDIQFAPRADDKATVLGNCVRFSILTSRLIRMEYSPSSCFEDRPSQVFWYREQPVPPFDVRRGEGSIEIETEHLLLRYLEREGFTAESLTILLKESGAEWHYGDTDSLNLKGTKRTLDRVDGAIALGRGLVSRSGWFLWDDSAELRFSSDGWLTTRNDETGYYDLYFFGFGQDYYGCLRDFSKIAGPAPMIPPWALGNWWSRYWAYTADEIIELMDEFEKRQVPLTVCVVDMDWHVVDTGNESSGWTGYTWNRELFPDPRAFISALHDRDLKVALNLHPAEGIHAHEAQYDQMAEAMGVDPQSKAPIPFAIEDPQFTRAYFEILHHPIEAEGIDFWWIDWQQDDLYHHPSLDPLWWLNHLHYFDCQRRQQKTPMIFSRWGGLGNHRYPIGFSGDTYATWDSLAFQPYFTATAANVNYGWWSHDIGGHVGGEEDAELYVRWVQFGVFSPIMRLHASNNPYLERRPWGYDAETERVAIAALRLRHALIPYLRTMAWHNHKESVPLVRPMYYDYARNEQAYHCRSQFLFGSELLVAPFTAPAESDTQLSRQAVWLPQGEWFDFFSGERWPGDGWQAIYGSLDDIPVFARQGAIIPLACEADQAIEACYELHVFPGADRSFELLESYEPQAQGWTAITHQWEEEEWTLHIAPQRRHGEFPPRQRTFEICFRGMHPNVTVTVERDNKVIANSGSYDPVTKSFKLTSIALDAQSKLTVKLQALSGSLQAKDDRLLRNAQKMLRAFRLNTDTKSILALQLQRIIEKPSFLADYQLALTTDQIQALAELITGAGVQHMIAYDSEGEEVVLWNNDATENVKWAFAAQEPNGLAHHERGPLPRFGFLAIGKATLTYHEGSQLAHGRIPISSWFGMLYKRIPHDQLVDVQAIVQFEISGENGYRGYLEIDQGSLGLREGIAEEPTVTVKAKAEDWRELINGDQTPTEMFLEGSLQVSGSFEFIANLADAFTFAPPGVYRAEKWRLDIDYLDTGIVRLGRS